MPVLLFGIALRLSEQPGYNYANILREVGKKVGHAMPGGVRQVPSRKLR